MEKRYVRNSIFKYCLALYWKAENEFLNLFFIADGNKGANHCNQYNFMIQVPAFSTLEKRTVLIS